ncbi:MAG: histone deacetylase family protein [Bacteroidales bacterium]
MKILFNKVFLDHNIGSMFEGSYRLMDFAGYPDVDADGEAYLELVHSTDYIDSIKGCCLNSSSIAEVKLSPASYSAACLGVGLSVKACEQGDLAVIRPPGHHAHRDKASGFCLFNNMAIAAQLLANKGKNVFILDIDGHHGDGTQEIFYESNKVFYCSIHQQNTYPYTGTFMEIGRGEGLGYTLNIPVPENSGESEFLKAVNKAIQAGLKFGADVVGVSAGFDGYRKDRLLNLNYSLHAFYECGYQLSKAFNDVFAILEGGYHPDLKECVEMFVNGVNIGARPSNIKWDHELSIG